MVCLLTPSQMAKTYISLITSCCLSPSITEKVNTTIKDSIWRIVKSKYTHTRTEGLAWPYGQNWCSFAKTIWTKLLPRCKLSPSSVTAEVGTFYCHMVTESVFVYLPPQMVPACWCDHMVHCCLVVHSRLCRGWSVISTAGTCGRKSFHDQMVV